MGCFKRGAEHENNWSLVILYPRVKYTALQTARSGGIKGQLVCTLTEYFSTVCTL